MAPRLEGTVSRQLAGGCPPPRPNWREAHCRCEDRSGLGNRVPTFVPQTRRTSISRRLLSSEVDLGGRWNETKERCGAVCKRVERRRTARREFTGAESFRG